MLIYRVENNKTKLGPFIGIDGQTTYYDVVEDARYRHRKPRGYPWRDEHKFAFDSLEKLFNVFDRDVLKLIEEIDYFIYKIDTEVVYQGDDGQVVFVDDNQKREKVNWRAENGPLV